MHRIMNMTRLNIMADIASGLIWISLYGALDLILDVYKPDNRVKLIIFLMIFCVSVWMHHVVNIEKMENVESIEHKQTIS